MRLPRLALLLPTLALALAAPAAVPKDPLVRSPLAAVAGVREGSPAGASGVRADDLVVSLNGAPDPTLEMLLAYRFDSERARDTELLLRREGGTVRVLLAQGDWGLDLRPDLRPTGVARWAEARGALRAKEAWGAGAVALEALAGEAEAAGARAAGCWFRLQLAQALREGGHPAEAAAATDALDGAAGGQGYFALQAALQRAQLCDATGDTAGMEAAFSRARGLAAAGGGELREAIVLSWWEDTLWRRGDLARAAALAAEAVAILHRLAPDTLLEAVLLHSQGTVAWNRGDLAPAREILMRALAIRQRLAPGSIVEGATLNNLGSLAATQGDLSAARDYFLRALAIRERLMPGSLRVAGSLNNLGGVAGLQGDLDAAREYCLQSVALLEKIAPDSVELSESLNNLGFALWSQGDGDAAREVFLKALAIQRRRAPESLAVASSLNNLGSVSLTAGDLKAAEDLYRQALALRERLAPGSLDEAKSLGDLGNAMRRQGDTAAARELCGRALALQERLAPGSIEQAETLRCLSECERADGDTARRVQRLAEAVAAVEAQRAKMGADSARSSFAAAHADFYTDLIAATLDAGQPEQAFETLERSRARSLLEMVSSRFIDLRGEVPDALLERRRELEAARSELASRLARADAKADPQEVEAWRSKLLTLAQQEAGLAEEIRRASPRLAALEYPQPLDFAGACAALDPGTLLLAYAVAEEETTLFALSKPRAGAPKLTVHRIPLKRRELGLRVRSLRSQLGAEAAGALEEGVWKARAESLYRSLLGPASRELAASERLLILPDGPLHLLPFSALLPGGKGLPRGLRREPLGLQRPMTFGASVTVYAELGAARRAAPAGAPAWTGFGDPAYGAAPAPGAPADRAEGLEPLPGSRAEVEAISALFSGRGRVLLGPEATEEAARRLSGAMPYVHFACHGLLDPLFPMNSALALAAPDGGGAPGDNRGDGLLQAWEVLQDVKVESDCVVLSACDTGGGRLVGGEGIVGLTRAFFYAGARSVVVSLWPVADDSTARLMAAFYRELLAGAPRDLALMRAQRELVREGGRDHPVYWAAFSLHGRPD